MYRRKRHVRTRYYYKKYQYYGFVANGCLDVRLVDSPAGITQEEGHTGFFHLPSAVLALVFIAGRIQPSISLVDREV